jgi:hypothetical protein
MGEAETPSAVPVDIAVETARWAAIPLPGADSDAARAAGPIVFIDGVRRVDRRIIANAGGTDHFGLLGAHAVGALRAADGPPVVLASRVTRLLVLGGGLDVGPLTVPLSDGQMLTYECAPIPDTAPEAALTGLQTAMRRAEAALASELAGAAELSTTSASRAKSASPSSISRSGVAQIELGDLAPLAAGALIVADGPLAYLERTRTPLLGLVKSLHRTYLAPREIALLTTLGPGERTPIFAILDQNRRYSWYLRLGRGGPADHPLAGIARIECASVAGISATVALADRSAGALLRAASTRERDPRSPQNLVPLGGLESNLRHRLGDRELIRRAITAELARLARRSPLPDLAAMPLENHR